MEQLFGSEFFVSFFQVVMIDLALAGDNAIVIGLAAAGLPADQRRRAILLGIIAATVLRIAFAAATTQLLEIAGGTNAYGDMNAVSPQLSLEDVHARDPDVVLANPTLAARIRSEPAWRGLRAVREGRVLAADEVLWGRPSVRMGEAAVALARVLHPEMPR